MRRRSLRWRILLFTVLPIVVLAFAALWTVHGTVAGELTRNVHGDLKRASAVFDDLMAGRADQLRLAGRVIVQDPRFFSVLTLPGSPADAQVRATVSGVAADFNALTHADVFEVLDPTGRLLASVGPDRSPPQGRAPFVAGAREGREVSGILVNPDAHYQVSATPVVVGRRVAGVLLVGERIGRELAERLRSLTRSEVTFISHDRATVTTLDHPADREATLAHVQRLSRTPGNPAQDGAVLEVSGGGHTYLALTAAIPGSAPGEGQYYVMERALDVENAFLREVQEHLLVLGAVMVIAALLIGFLISERITSPVSRLVGAAEEMERGNYDYPIEVASRDEIGYLAERFGDMRQKQRTYVKHLEEAARVKAQFISVASHELRTPITLIRAWHELFAAEQAGPLTPSQRRGLEAIATGIDKLEGIAESATRMAQIEGDRMPVDLGEHRVADLVEEAIDATRRLGAGRRIAIEREVDASLDSVVVDGPRLVQALGQLLGNAVRFTPDGGHVVLRAHRDGDDAVIEIEDDGIGIAPEKRVILEARGSVVRDSAHHHSSGSLEFNSAGLGLGLAIARGIVEAHHGTLAFADGPHRGTRVVVRLPGAIGMANAA